MSPAAVPAPSREPTVPSRRPRSGPSARSHASPGAGAARRVPGGGTRGDGPRVHRRRLGVVAVVAVLTVLLTVLTGDPGADAGQPAAVDVRARAVVEPGESLWEVAVDHAPPGSDPRAYLERLRRLNDLEAGSPVPAWTGLRLPAADGPG